MAKLTFLIYAKSPQIPLSNLASLPRTDIPSSRNEFIVYVKLT